jgi:hypothetical protein
VRVGKSTGAATLNSKSDLAVTLAKQGELATTRRLQEEGLAAFERLLGAEHPDTLISKQSLAYWRDETA